MENQSIRTLIVEDDPTVAELHRRFVLAVEGFTVVGKAKNGREALSYLDLCQVDLVLADIYMPDCDGMEFLRQARERREKVDVIMLTAAQEGEKIEEAMRLGVFDYLLKPFDFARFRKTLLSFQRHLEEIEGKGALRNQEDIDRVFSSRSILEEESGSSLPKGIQKNTIDLILSVFTEENRKFASSEIAEACGLSRVTVQHYCRYLVQGALLAEETVYRQTGRPVKKYFRIG
jgi:response regulator of citrate/malate metabolism